MAESKSKFRITLQFQHPTLSDEAFFSTVSLPIWYKRIAGQPRKTPKGTPIGGIYKRTSVSFYLHEAPLCFDDTSIEAVVVDALDVIGSDFMSRFTESGGKIVILIGLFFVDDIMFEFSTGFISRLAEHSISITSDAYVGEA